MKPFSGKKYKAILLLLCLCLLFLFLAQLLMQPTLRERACVNDARAASKEFGVPLALVLAVCRTESNFQSGAVSSAGACGLMQLLPETFAFLRDERLCETHADADIFDPLTNLRYGSYYLFYLLEKFENTETALAAYNAGEGRVTEWLRDPALSPDGKRLLHIPFPETAAYVEKTMAAFEKYQEKYPF